MRDKIIFVLPFIQISIALITMSRLPEPPPQYFCQIARDTYGNPTELLICNPS